MTKSKYTPHTGAKERERAKRCYMLFCLNGPQIKEAIRNHDGDGHLNIIFHDRCTPTICQQSKKQYARSMREEV